MKRQKVMRGNFSLGSTSIRTAAAFSASACAVRTTRRPSRARSATRSSACADRSDDASWIVDSDRSTASAMSDTLRCSRNSDGEGARPSKLVAYEVERWSD